MKYYPVYLSQRGGDWFEDDYGLRPRDIRCDGQRIMVWSKTLQEDTHSSRWRVGSDGYVEVDETLHYGCAVQFHISEADKDVADNILAGRSI